MAPRTLFLEVLLVCQVCEQTLFAESVDHGPAKNPEGWVRWMLERAAVHQGGECKGKLRQGYTGGRTEVHGKKTGNA